MCAAEAQTDQAFHDQATQELCVLDYLRHADASEMEYAAFDDTYQAATGSIVSMDAAVQRARKIVDELEHEIAVVRSDTTFCTRDPKYTTFCTNLFMMPALAAS
jgi:hypothetical protein